MLRLYAYLIGSVVVLAAGFYTFWSGSSKEVDEELVAALDRNAYRNQSMRQWPDVELVDPQMAPKELKPIVMEGFHLFLETKKLLPDNVGNTLCCCNCHFAGGNSLGGTNGGIPLVGVTHIYPRALPDNKTISLAERINGCFMRSMNGTPIPPDGPAMKAFIAYMEWISTPVKKGEDPHWLGLKPLKSKHKADPEQGEAVFAKYCAACHGRDGQGMHQNYDLGYPPVWGDHSFNGGAGMNRLNLIASFVYYNMPYQEPCLSVEEALDVASYVIKQSRPFYAAPKSDNTSVRPHDKEEKH